jgi:hypothetical protein
MEPMYPRFNEMVLMAVASLMPDGYDVTDDSTVCDTLDKVKRHHRKTGRIMVWTGESEQSIFGQASVNHAFRAWHDYVHVLYDLPFTKAGEHRVMRIQQTHVDTLGGFEFTPEEKNLFYKLLECEVDGQLEHLIKTGEFVKDQRAFATTYMENNHG